jgi:putative membrane protein
VVTEGSLNQSLDKAVKHYSSLFQLPSSKKVLLFLTLACLGSGILPTLALLSPFEGLVSGLLLGFALLAVDLGSSYIISRIVLPDDPVYDLRRTAALSLFSRLFWFVFLVIGVFGALFFGLTFWVKLCLLGFPAVIIVHLIALTSTSSKSQSRVFAASVLQPLLSIIPFSIFWSTLPALALNLAYEFLFLICSIVISYVSAYFFMSAINRVGEKELGFPSLVLLRAFLLDWIVNLNAPLEELLEKLGEEQSIEVSILKFDTSTNRAIMVVPSVHPGPFKNVGSSFLPYFIKSAVEQKLGCVACVPLGLLGHELDLASQAQNQKIVDSTVIAADFAADETKATPFVKVTNGLTTGCCQIFGKHAFLSFSLAPKTTEDLPQELNGFVHDGMEKHGLTRHVVVNAHDSIDGIVQSEEVLESLKAVTESCLDKTVSMKSFPFKVGAASVVPREFKLEDGMGLGGITVLVVEVNKQKAAYVVVDGNNMVSGLRERILLSLKTVGVEQGEVFTTDTHSVNALSLNRRGYHPVGEAMDKDKLIDYIIEAVNKASTNLEGGKAAVQNVVVPKVKVIGDKSLEKLCVLVDDALRTAKKAVVPIFGVAFVFLMLLLMFL